MRRASVVAVAGMLFAMLPLAPSNAVTVGTIVYGDYFGGKVAGLPADLLIAAVLVSVAAACLRAPVSRRVGFAYIQGAIKGPTPTARTSTS
jgi:hypothetical protein